MGEGGVPVGMDGDKTRTHGTAIDHERLEDLNGVSLRELISGYISDEMPDGPDESRKSVDARSITLEWPETSVEIDGPLIDVSTDGLTVNYHEKK